MTQDKQSFEEILESYHVTLEDNRRDESIKLAAEKYAAQFQQQPICIEAIEKMAEKEFVFNCVKDNQIVITDDECVKYERAAFIKGFTSALGYSAGDKDKPKVVCFCGSTRFAEWFMIKRWELEKQGIITLGINILPNNYFAEGNAHGAEQEGVKHVLDELHKRKIDLSDEVFILNFGGYIGESTRNELNYAISKNKPITYLEPPIKKQ